MSHRKKPPTVRKTFILAQRSEPHGAAAVDSGAGPSNNRSVLTAPASTPGRRLKTYSAESGYVYQYYYEELRSPHQRNHAEGSEYIFMATRDRKTLLPVAVLLQRRALDAWAAGHGRQLTGSEQYAAVKMRLFRFFDETEDFDAERLTPEVTAENIDELLASLDIA